VSKKRRIVRATYCVSDAPLGRLPRGEELAKELGSIHRLDLPNHRGRSFAQALCGRDAVGGERVLAGFVLDALDRVRAKEGLLFFQADGAGLAGTELSRGDAVSVLTAVGVHGRRCKQLKNSSRVCTLSLSRFRFIEERSSSCKELKGEV
jgi:hypothetical protein